MPIYDLPPVERNTLPEPTVAGTWRPIDLDALAESLKIDEVALEPGDLKSIPDAWAQLQLTSDALFSARHDARDAVIRQWRGLLALFALQPLYEAEYDLRLSKLGFNAKLRGESKLRGLLTDLLPAQALVDDLSWEYLSLIELVPTQGTDPVLLGITSPMTLVAASRSVAHIRFAGVPWLADGLGDPTAGHALAPESWTILVQYLNGLTAALRANPASADKTSDRDALIRHLATYRDACAARQSGAPQLSAHKLAKKAWPHPFFTPLGETFFPKEQKGSDCLVELRVEADEIVRKALLIDPALVETFGRPATAIRVWNRYTLADAGSPATLDLIRREAAAEDILVVQPEDFFTAELVRLNDARIPAHRAGAESTLLPLSPLALLFAKGVDDLAGRVGITSRGVGECEATFGVTMIGADGNEVIHALSRTYAADAIVLMPPPDDLALWPDFESDKWPWTFLRFQYNPKTELQTRFGISARFIERDVAAALADDRLQRLSEWGGRFGRAVDRRLIPGRSAIVKDAAGNLLLRTLRAVQDDANNVVAEQHETSAGVEAIFFSRRRSDREPSSPVGCVLVKRGGDKSEGKAAQVAIDFGTTNTIAYTRIGESESRRVAFNKRVVFPIQHRFDESQIAAEYTSFFPLRAHDTPLPTVARKRDFTGLTPDLRRMLEDGDPGVGMSHFVFFMPALEQAVDPKLLIALVNKGSLQFDLKWGEGKRMSHLVQAFISQLMVMIAAELVQSGVALNRIAWRFSYPQSFRPHDRTTFETILRSAQSELFGKPDPDDAGRRSLTLVTEGEAAALYFMRDPEQSMQPQGRLMLMLDIGGGSTDMAIRLDEALIWRGSVKLAGTNFFRRYLVNNFEMLDAIDHEAILGVTDKQGAGSSLDPLARKRQLVDLLVARPDFSSTFALQQARNARDERWIGLRQCGAVALGGILYFGGMVLAAFKDSGVLSEDDLKEATVAFGGRGSSLFRELDPHDDHRPTLAAICELALVPTGIDLDDAVVAPVFSKGPKEEVARGLLLHAPDPVASAAAPRKARKSEQIDRTLPIGLAVTVNPMSGEAQTQIAATAEITTLLGARQVTKVDLEAMNVFLKGLRKQTGLTIDLSSGADRTIAQQTRAELNTALAKLAPEDRDPDDGDAQALEPPFVSALRLLVDMMSESTADRRKLITVRER